MDNKILKKLEEMTLRQEEIEIRMENDRQTSEKEKEELKEKLKEESEGKQNVEKRIQSLESKSDTLADNLSLFEKLSSTEGRGERSTLWREDRRTWRDSVSSIPTSSSCHESIMGSFT